MDNINGGALAEGITALRNHSVRVAEQVPGIRLWSELVSYFSRDAAAQSVTYQADFLLDGKNYTGEVEFCRNGRVIKRPVTA